MKHGKPEGGLAETADSTATPAPEANDARHLLFTTEKCPNCRIAYGYLEKAGVAYEKMNAADHPDLVKQFGVTQAPTLIVTSSEGFTKYAGAGAIRKYLMDRGTL